MRDKIILDLDGTERDQGIDWVKAGGYGLVPYLFL